VLKPSDGAAVAGGNVETSQAIVEALLKALGNIGWESAASSQSTMNNVLFGNGNFSFYETIGGGAGASDGCNGASGIQTHMTNTRSTPVESIEREYPLRIVRYMVRENSGGGGLFYGGNGVVREFEILEDCECTVLSNHREAGVEGMNGGGNGKAGKNLLVREGVELELDSRVMMELREGDKLRIETPGGGGYGSDAENKK
jgi:N-methylhydantoinase B/oxoprolinase/acetone carboxylase alpha subunit